MSALEPPAKKARVIRTPGFAFPSKPTFKLPETSCLRSPASFKIKNDYILAFGKENIGHHHFSNENAGSPLKTPTLPFPIAPSRSTPRRPRSREPLTQSYNANTDIDVRPNARIKKAGAISAADALSNPFVPPSPSPQPIPRVVRVLQPPSFTQTQSSRPPKCGELSKPSTSTCKSDLQILSHPPNYTYTFSNSDNPHPFGTHDDDSTHAGPSSRYHQEISKGITISPNKRDRAHVTPGRPRKFVRNGLAERFAYTVNKSDTAFMFWRKEIQREPRHPVQPCFQNFSGVMGSAHPRRVNAPTQIPPSIARRDAGIQESSDSPIANSTSSTTREFRLPPEAIRVRVEEILGVVPDQPRSHIRSSPEFHHDAPDHNSCSASSNTKPPLTAVHSVLTRCVVVSSQPEATLTPISFSASASIIMVFKCLSLSAAYTALPTALESPECGSRLRLMDPVALGPDMNSCRQYIPPTENPMSRTILRSGMDQASSDYDITGTAVAHLDGVDMHPVPQDISKTKKNPEPIPRQKSKGKAKNKTKLSSAEHLEIGREVLIWKPFIILDNKPPSSISDDLTSLNPHPNEPSGLTSSGIPSADDQVSISAFSGVVPGPVDSSAPASEEPEGIASSSERKRVDDISAQMIFCSRFLVVR